MSLNSDESAVNLSANLIFLRRRQPPTTRADVKERVACKLDVFPHRRVKYPRSTIAEDSRSRYFPPFLFPIVRYRFVWRGSYWTEAKKEEGKKNL